MLAFISMLLLDLLWLVLPTNMLQYVYFPFSVAQSLIRSQWRWGYWGILIAQTLSMAVLILLYYPPKHPRGIPWKEALMNLDYIGMLSFTGATAMILSAIVYVQLIPSDSPLVIGLLVAGFVLLIFFGLWETFASPKESIAPTRLFTANKGRRLTAPFICGFVVTMVSLLYTSCKLRTRLTLSKFYYGTNITWPAMLGVFFTSATTPPHIVYLLATVQGFGIFTGAMLLSFGNKIGHWKWQMGVPITIMTLFGALFAIVKPNQESMGIAFAFLSSMGYGYAQYLSIAYIQMGADQTELGIAGGLAGVARYAGGAVAVTTFATILTTTQNSHAATGIISAAEAAGASPGTAQAVLAALPLGATALEKVPGLTTAIATAAGGAFVQSYVAAIK